jgi:hypothetical protein
MQEASDPNGAMFKILKDMHEMTLRATFARLRKNNPAKPQKILIALNINNPTVKGVISI